MRRIAATTALLVTAAGIAVGHGGAANAAPEAARQAVTPAAVSSSRYTAITPQRLLDTRKRSDPHFGAVRPAGAIALKVAGVASVPATATAVVLNVTVTQPVGRGHITVFPHGSTQPTASNVNFERGETVANAVVVKVGSAGAVDLYNGSGGSSQLVADVSGYFGAATTDTPGGFTALNPTRLLDTRTGTGGHRGAVGGKRGVAFAAGGVAGIPSTASAVVLNVTVTAPTRGGHITAYPAGSALPTASNLNFTAGQTVPDLVVVPLGAGGKIALNNGSFGTSQLFADVFGYFTAGLPTAPGAFGALSPGRILDTRAGNGAPRRAVPAHGTVTLAVTGRGGVPRTHVSAAVLTVTATSPTRGGHLAVYPSGAAPASSTLNFTAGDTVPNLVVTPVSSAGTIKITNESSGTVQLLADVTGFVRDNALAVPPTTTSRYVSGLAAISDSSANGEGCADGASAATLVLLDVGAQTVTAPLSPANPGVALVRNNPAVRVAYATLVQKLQGYLAGFAACRSAATTARIAVGTSNDGAFDPAGANYYAPATRGRDWANQVIDPLVAAQPAGVRVVGADDIESYFASTEAQAETWVRAYLNNTAADLIDNGSADNCPDTYGSRAECGAVRDTNGVSKRWTRANYVALAYALGPGRISVLPQIYFDLIPNQAAEWVNIDATSGRALTFEGALTQHGIGNCDGGCGNTGSQGWAELYNGLATIVSTPSLPVATDLQPN